VVRLAHLVGNGAILNSNLASTNFVITFFAVVFFPFSLALVCICSFINLFFFLLSLRSSLSFASQLLDFFEAGIVSGYYYIVRTIFLSPSFPLFSISLPIFIEGQNWGAFSFFYPFIFIFHLGIFLPAYGNFFPLMKLARAFV